MSERKWMDAVHHGKRASARWAFPFDLSEVRAEGRVIGYSPGPMVLIKTDDGEQIWWGAELTIIDDQEAK